MHTFVARAVLHWWIVFSNLNVKRIMGLFDAIFGSSKKEQEQPIRDKLKKRKDFEKILKIRLAEIDRYKAYLTTEQESELFFCRVVGYDSIDVIQIRYSMDGGLKELQKIIWTLLTTSFVIIVVIILYTMTF